MRVIVSIDIPKLRKNNCSSINKPKKKKKPKDISALINKREGICPHL